MAEKKMRERVKEVNAALKKYGFGKFLNTTIKQKIFPSKDEDYDILEATDMPRNLRMMFQELGTSFIKLGQLLSSRPDIVGDKLASEFEKLQDDNPPISYEEVKRIVESELGGNIDELFAEFSKESLATASIGQVHSAVLPTGEKVAVKVQKEGIAENLELDLEIMHYFANKIHDKSDEMRGYNLPGIMDQFDHNLHIELDYTNELINLNIFTENFKEDESVHIPIAYPDYCTSKVLTMEFVEGTNMHDVFESESEEFDKPLIAKRALDAFMKMVLIDGFFHDDPHPGNLIVQPDNVVCFIDLGSAGILDNDFRKNLCDFLLMVADKDVKGVVNQFIYMGIIEYNMDTTDLKRDLRDMFIRFFADTSGGLDGVFDSLLSLMQRYQIILPNEFVTMARGISMMESVVTTLDPNMDMMASIEPIAKQAMGDRLNVKTFISDKKGSLIYYKNMFKSLFPLMANSIHKLENDDMKINLEVIRLDRIVSKLSLVIIIAALLMSSSIVMTINRGPMLWDMPLIAVAGYAVCLILGLISIINYFYER